MSSEHESAKLGFNDIHNMSVPTLHEFMEVHSSAYFNSPNATVHCFRQALRSRVCLSLLRVLVDAGLDVNARAVDMDGWTALHFAAFERDATAVAALLMVGAVPTACSTGLTPMEVACGRRDDDAAAQVVFVLLRANVANVGADGFAEQLKEMYKCCLYACAGSSADTVFALKQSQNFDSVCSFGNVGAGSVLLMRAVKNEKHGAQIIPILLSSPQTDPYVVQDSLTALDLACEVDAKECVRVLLARCDQWNLTRVARTSRYLAKYFRTLTNARTGYSLLYKFRPRFLANAMCLLTARKRGKLSNDTCNLLLDAMALQDILEVSE